uniref:FecR family protein n=1 Tax=Gelidibacter sp. TaxID=2018083 RepID=UPI00404A263D
MERDELILKWLNNDLTAAELEAFKQFEDYEALTTLNTHLQGFKSKEYTVSEELETVLKAIETHKKTKKNWLPTLMRVAAILVICFGIFYYTTTLDIKISTVIAEKQNIKLPDASKVAINSQSSVTFNKHDWKANRNVLLDGEAYFEVAKGSTFEVTTPNGIVRVLGTKFNVKQRDDDFEVVCYEGLVQVVYGSHTETLVAGDTFLILDGKLVANEKENLLKPSWINNQSTFKSLPYKEVIAEFERQYDIRLETQDIDNTQLFTGSFTHNNLDVALKSITLPLQLTYTKTGKTITLKRE